jgi:hypothetical protein
MFDRYPGDNNTKLEPQYKMYVDEKGYLTIPAINIYSLLAAENTKSVCRQFFGKQGKTIALGIASYTNIEPFDIPITDGKEQIRFTEFGEKIYVHKSVARLKGGIPNPKQRPTVSLPWNVEFTIHYVENTYCSLENLKQALATGGTLGLGTFRPFFGRYELTCFEEVPRE